MKKTLFFKCVLALLFAISLNFDGFSQGTTTSSISGRVIDDTNMGLFGANILVVHEPTGSKFGASADDDGKYRISNLDVGGPYRIEISYVGFKTSVQKAIYLQLGQELKFKTQLSSDAQALDVVVISAKGKNLKTGQETNISKEDIKFIPTVSRSLNDFTRLTPQANFTNDGGLSIAGMNNRFNAIFIDGAVNNDVFGLAQSGTNGGQAGISPISIDAIEQIQIVIAPYDVKLGGFAGGGLNIVTKRGTNETHGSAYYLFKNENLSGKTPTDNPNIERTRLASFDSKTYGLTLGGPIVKDKLFYFVNAEIQKDEVPKPFSFDDYEGDSNAADIENLVQYLATTHNYDPGKYLDNVAARKGKKVLVRFDYNINETHKLTARHSYVQGEVRDFDQDLRPDSRNLRFQNSGIYFPSITNSTAIELKSNFDKFNNNLIIGRTTVDEDRDILGGLFPRVEVTDGSGLISFGTDAFSYTNDVQQKIWTITDNLTWHKGKHSFTVGTHNEFFDFTNRFVIFSTPLYFYGDLNSFTSGAPGFSLFGHELPTNPGDPLRFGDAADNAAAIFSAMQLSFYGQDEIQVSDNFKLSLGLRADIPIFTTDAPEINNDFNDRAIPLIESFGYDLQGAQASKMPTSGVMWSPRAGFNWDMKGDGTSKLRGGLGVFTSRIPFVWPSGILLRSGVSTGFSPGFGAFTTTPEEWETRANVNKPTGDVDIYAKKFKYPQIFRTNLGLDTDLPGGISGTFDFMYSKTLNNIYAQNVNVKPSVQTLEGADNRPIFNNGDPVDPTYGRISFLSNTSKGYSYNFSTQLKKTFGKSLTTSVSYSYTKAESIFDGFNAIGSNLWRDNHNVNGRNNATLATSGFSTGSRVTGFVSYRKEYAKNLATTIGLFYNGQSGQPYSYTYNDAGALTSEDSKERSLIYVPNDASEIVFDELDSNGDPTYTQVQKDAMWNSLNGFIENDSYLNSRRGKYAERNEARSPFESIFDLKIIQDVYLTTNTGKRHTFQIGIDIFNFSNMLNKEWGRKYFVGSTGTENKSFELLNFKGFLPGTKQPVFNFQDPGETWDIVTSGTNSARWNAQITLKYLF
jgi:YD repeat-containing protein